MRRVVIALGGVAALGVLALAGLACADPTKLSGSVGPGFEISLEDAAGSSVTHLDPGSYQLQVSDQSSEHDFHLQGPGGVDASTDIEGTGTKTFALTLVDGTYRFFCDVHPTRMQGSFTVGAVTSPPTTTTTITPTTPPPPPAGRLTLTVTGSTITLKKCATIVRTLPSGSYSIRVTDRSNKQNAHLSGAGVNRKTGIAFVGAVTWKVTLKAGTLVYRSDGSPKLAARKVRVS
jgi:hypothetical protein